MACQDCKHYRMMSDGPYCVRGDRPRATSPIQDKECFTQKEDNQMEEKTATKTCPRCGRTLPVEQFGRHSKTKDGYQPICHDCRVAANKVGRSRKSEEVQFPVVNTTAEPLLKDATLAELVGELRRRGYSGTVVTTIEF